ncbi:MAG: Cation diffusion facilitator family transporter [Hydrocarboniphaga sp.]|uniref:cation diffusion facilitator family transporter n=1 Tax=Hydrocarboniphaga sp. TaxID=2033016 RepID=UPI00261EE3BA|nr:cation diffusion facilitator family transporter [Hydrocarboniphaga sp.]MDB5969133.1 Cation diffusion facilitator family transporter [Hydrocarboniphaga sp.]
MQAPTTPESDDGYASGVRRILWLTLILNVGVCLLKLAVGLWTGSLAVMADAVHSLTDSLNNVMGLVVMRWSAPPPDREHPYGHLKFEAVGALGIAAMLGIACFEVVKPAVMRLFESDTAAVQMNPSALVLLVLVLAVNIFVAIYERRAGQRLHSKLLLADATQTFGDIWITLGVIAGSIGIWLTGWWWLDVALAIPVALAVLWSGWVVVKGNLPWLVDATAIPLDEIEALAMSVPGVVDCHQVHSRGLVGRQVFVEMHLITNAGDIETSHRITEEIERLLLAKYGPVEATIHVEPERYAENHA